MCVYFTLLSVTHMLITYMHDILCGESCYFFCYLTEVKTDYSIILGLYKGKETVCIYSHYGENETCVHLFILFKFRKGWLDWAKTGFEITDGPNRAGRAVFQLWGYHYFVKEKPQSSDPFPAMLSTCVRWSSKVAQGVIRLRVSPPGLIWKEFQPHLLCKLNRIQLLMIYGSWMS